MTNIRLQLISLTLDYNQLPTHHLKLSIPFTLQLFSLLSMFYRELLLQGPGMLDLQLALNLRLPKIFAYTPDCCPLLVQGPLQSSHALLSLAEGIFEVRDIAREASAICFQHLNLAPEGLDRCFAIENQSVRVLLRSQQSLL